MKVESLSATFDVPADTLVTNCNMSGTLLKETQKKKCTRFFVLRNEFLVYYETQQSSSPLGVLYLEHATITPLPVRTISNSSPNSNSNNSSSNNNTGPTTPRATASISSLTSPSPSPSPSPSTTATATNASPNTTPSSVAAMANALNTPRSSNNPNVPPFNISSAINSNSNSNSNNGGSSGSFDASSRALGIVISIPKCKEYTLTASSIDLANMWLSALQSATYDRQKNRISNLEAEVNQLRSDLEKFVLQKQVNTTSEAHRVAQAEELIENLRRQLMQASALGMSPRPRDRERGSLRDTITESIVGESLKEGWLLKRGLFNRGRKKRWFQLRGSSLLYYKSNQDDVPLGVIPLENCIIVLEGSQPDSRLALPPKLGRTTTLDLTNPNLAFKITNVVTERTFDIIAQSIAERDDWIISIERAMKVAQSSFRELAELSSIVTIEADFERLIATVSNPDVRTIEEVLKDPEHAKCFRAFVAKENSIENLMFYLDVESFRKEQSQETAQNIFVRYIGCDAPFEVNLSAAIVQRINEQLVAGVEGSMFDEAQSSIRNLMQDDTLSRYRTAVKSARI